MPPSQVNLELRDDILSRRSQLGRGDTPGPALNPGDREVWAYSRSHDILPNNILVHGDVHSHRGVWSIQDFGIRLEKTRDLPELPLSSVAIDELFDSDQTAWPDLEDFQYEHTPVSAHGSPSTQADNTFAHNHSISPVPSTSEPHASPVQNSPAQRNRIGLANDTENPNYSDSEPWARGSTRARNPIGTKHNNHILAGWTIINTIVTLAFTVAALAMGVVYGKASEQQNQQNLKLTIWRDCVDLPEVLRNSTVCKALQAQGFDSIANLHRRRGYEPRFTDILLDNDP